MTDTFDRTQLDGKDRGQLSEIASALGVKAVSRMRKADLVDAIVSATAGSRRRGRPGERANGSSRSDRVAARKIRSTVSGGDDLASLADEEERAGDRQRARRRDGADPAARSTPAGNGSAATDLAEHADRPSSDGAPRPRGRLIEDPWPTTARRRHDGGQSSQHQQASRRRRRPGQPPPPSASRPRSRAPRRRRGEPSAGGVRRARTRVERTKSRRLQRRPDRARGSARPARRGLRLPAHDRLPRRAATTRTCRRRRCGGSGCARATT